MILCVHPGQFNQTSPLNTVLCISYPSDAWYTLLPSLFHQPKTTISWTVKAIKSFIFYNFIMCAQYHFSQYSYLQISSGISELGIRNQAWVSGTWPQGDTADNACHWHWKRCVLDATWAKRPWKTSQISWPPRHCSPTWLLQGILGVLSNRHALHSLQCSALTKLHTCQKAFTKSNTKPKKHEFKVTTQNAFFNGEHFDLPDDNSD
jgi:hypothetical protein